MDDREEIRRAIALYPQLLDDQRWEDIGELFCRDGELPWEGRTLRGREAIVSGLPSTQPARGGIKHLVFPPVIEMDGDEAWAWSDVLIALVPADGDAAMSYVGRYHDRLRREDGRWRFVSHVTVRTGEPLPEGVDPPPGP